ncbi:MAG: VCBS repeat-containing protein [Proteobacteria bacterium]|nr:VCBS repeat-containing protein [Pseudomonadota bacterium]
MRTKEMMLAFLCFFIFGSTVVYGKDTNEKYRIVFSAFDISSVGSYAYLSNGIQSMLASRLAARDRVVVLDRTFSERELISLKNKQTAVAKGSETTVADYLVSGSLYGLKTGLSIQVVLYPFAADKETLRFEALVKNSENMITDVDKLSLEIAQSVFGYKTVDDPVALKAGVEGEGVSGFITAHPEAAYKKSVNTGVVVGAAGSTVQVTAREGKRSVTLSSEIRALATGDIDGDGADEIVVLVGNTLELYRQDGKKISKVAVANLPPALACHAINMADLDKNGRVEIYVSSTDGLNISSLIVGWDKEKGFRIVTENIPWYIRPLLVPGKGWRLAGQKRGVGKTELVKAGIYLLDLDATNTATQGEQLPLPSGVNLFDFVFADLDGDGAPETVAIDKKERIKVFNRANELLWVSKRTFGGSQIYLGPSRGGAVSVQDRRNFTLEEDIDRELIFVPGRLVVADVDNNGRQEIVVNENTLSAMSILEKMRIYNDGIIVGLAWDGAALNEAWRTGTFKGYIAGFGFSVLSKPGDTGQITNAEDKKTLVSLHVGHLPRSGTLVGLLPGTGETQITAYDLEFSVGKTK